MTYFYVLERNTSGPHIDERIRAELGRCGIPTRKNSSPLSGEIRTNVEAASGLMKLERLSSTYRLSRWIPVDLVMTTMVSFPNDILLDVVGETDRGHVYPWRESHLVTKDAKIVRPLWHRQFLKPDEREEDFVFVDDPRKAEARPFIEVMRFRTEESLSYFWKLAKRRNIYYAWGYFDIPCVPVDDQVS